MKNEEIEGYEPLLEGLATYKLRNTLPDDMKAMLPEPEEIAERLKIFEE